MANEFVLRNGLKVTGSADIQTSLTVPTLTVSGTGSFSNLTVSGDLDVTGNINAVNRTDLNVTDNLVVVAAGATSTSQADGAGLFISGANASLTWDNGNSRLVLNKPTYASTLSASLLAGDGQSITSLNASNISSGVLSSARLSGTYSIDISGNASTLGGQNSSFYRNASNINAGTISDSYLPATISSDITGNAATATSASYANNASTADLADDSTLLNGQAASYYTNASNLSSGTIDDARLPGTISSDITGNAATATTATTAGTANTASYVAAANVDGTVASATNSTQLNGQAASYYTNASNLSSGTVPSARLNGTYSIDISGNASTADSATTATEVANSLNNGDGISTLTYNGSAGASVSVDNTVIRTTGAQTLGGVKTFTDEIKISTNSAQASIIDKDDSTTITNTISSVHEVTATATDAVFFDYVVKDGTTNLRAGTLMVVSNGSTVAYTEVSTTDIGNTSPVTLSADISGGNIRFRAVASSGTWTVRSLARTI